MTGLHWMGIRETTSEGIISSQHP